MRRNLILISVPAAIGAALALLGQGAKGGLTWAGLSAPLTAAGEGLRALSLSGAAGNLAAWAAVLLLCALPLLLFLPARKLGVPRGRGDLLLPLCSLVLLALCFFTVNPTWLGEPASAFFPVAALWAAVSVLAAWFVLTLLRGFDAAPAQALGAAIRPLLTGCAALWALGSAFGRAAEAAGRWSAVLEGNTATGGALIMGTLPDFPDFPGSLNFTLAALVILAVLELLPDLLAALTLLWGAELAGALGALTFGQAEVELCGKTAASCRRAAQAAALLSAAANLFQLCTLTALRSSYFTVILPLFPVVLSAALYLLCRCLERGKQLQDDSDSII